MAANGSTPEFRIPQEPLPVPPIADDDKPVPFIGSDDDSFVVLGKSLVIDSDDLSLEDDNSNLGKSIIQEAKQLIRDELDRMEIKQTKQELNGVPENHVVNTTPNGGEPLNYRSTNGGTMDHSCSVLPAMPQPQLYPRGETEGNDIPSAISIISFAPSEFASEELQNKVTQLIDENVHLKDTILQNNMSMKAQYEKIVAWQKDVEKVHEAHKEKFRHAKQCIEALKKENARLEQQSNLLQQEIENLRYSVKLQESEHGKTKQILTQTSENNLKDFELDVANKKIKDLEEALEKAQKHQKEGSDDLSSAPSKWTAMEEKLGRYEKELEEAYKKNRELEKCTSVNDTHYVEKLKVTEERLLLTEAAHQQTNQEIISLRNQLAKNLQTTDESPRLQFELQQAKIKIAELDDILTSRNATLIDSNIRATKTEEQLGYANEKVKAMEETVAALQLQLEETKIEVWKNKQKLNEKDTQLEMVHKDLEATQNRKQQQTVPQNPDEIAYLRQQLMQSQIALTQCDQNRAVAHAQLAKRENEMSELRRQLEEKQNETDAMFALRTQLDVYKSDFEAERDAKEDIKRDKNKLSEDLQHLHRRNQQLQEEIELLRERGGGAPRPKPEAGNSSQKGSGWATGRNNQTHYKCPKCQFGFQTLNAVENHVMRCIELDDSLP